MENKEFDDILKNKLSELSKDSSTPDWDRMNRYIQEDSAKDQAFDEQIKRKLEKISVAKYSPHKWNNLYELIDRRIKNKQRILISKLLELSVFLLFIMTLVNLGSYNNTPSSPKSNSQNSIIASSFSPDEKNENFGNIHSSSESDYSSVLNRSNLKTDVSKSEISLVNTSNIDVDNPIKGNINTIYKESDKQLFAETSLETDVILDLYSNESKSKFVKSISDLKLNVPEINEGNNFVSNDEITGIPISELNMATIEPIFNPIKVKTPGNWFASISVNHNYNLIESNLHKELTSSRNPQYENSTAIIKQSTNASYNAELGYEFKNIGISTGFQYQEITYNPSLIFTSGNLQSKYRETIIQGLKYKLLSLPLNFNVKLFKFKSWKAEVQGGLIANLLLSGSENIEQNIVSGTRITPVSEDNQDLSMLHYNFNDGLLDDQPSTSTYSETLEKSYFYRSNLGLIISKKITPRTSIFSNVNYLYHLPVLSGIEQFDIINSYSFGIGLKQRIG